MTVFVNTPVSMTGLDYDVGTKSLDGVVSVDFDLTSLTGHCGLANNRQGNNGWPATGLVAGTNQIWIEAQGVIIDVDGNILLETWYRKFDTAAPEMTACKVGHIGAVKLVRVEHSTFGKQHIIKVYSVHALGGPVCSLLATVEYSSGANSESRSTYFSPFVFGGTATFLCTRKD